MHQVDIENIPGLAVVRAEPVRAIPIALYTEGRALRQLSVPAGDDVLSRFVGGIVDERTRRRAERGDEHTLTKLPRVRVPVDRERVARAAGEVRPEPGLRHVPPVEIAAIRMPLGPSIERRAVQTVAADVPNRSAVAGPRTAAIDGSCESGHVTRRSLRRRTRDDVDDAIDGVWSPYVSTPVPG